MRHKTSGSGFLGGPGILFGMIVFAPFFIPYYIIKVIVRSCK